MLALGDFWLLHGFRPKDQLMEILERVEPLSILLPVFENSGYKGLYQYVMELPQDGVNKMLQPLSSQILPDYVQGKLQKSDPNFWAARAMVTYPDSLDRGIFSIYFFNLVHLKEGQAVFQGAGLPHAYLEGQNVELMSNSDNVLRGGLTPKFVDVAELMRHIHFEAVTPEILEGGKGEEKKFDCPVKDFSLTVSRVGEQGYGFTTNGPEIILILEGEGEANGYSFHKGDTFFAVAGETLELKGRGIRLVRAWVP
jgi:mannose-6-phosphate isomerase